MDSIAAVYHGKGFLLANLLKLILIPNSSLVYLHLNYVNCLICGDWLMKPLS